MMSPKNSLQAFIHHSSDSIELIKILKIHDSNIYCKYVEYNSVTRKIRINSCVTVSDLVMKKSKSFNSDIFDNIYDLAEVYLNKIDNLQMELANKFNNLIWKQ